MRHFRPSPAFLKCVIAGLVELILFLAAAFQCKAQATNAERHLSFQDETHAVISETRTARTFAAPMRFRGWNHAVNDPAYKRRFSRSRAGVAIPAPRMYSDWYSDSHGVTLAGASATTLSAKLPWAQPRSSIPAGYIPVSVATADFNGDGNIDWVVCNAGDNDLWVYLGDGHGGWKLPVMLPVTGTGVSAVVTGDFRGNGRQDIAIAEADSGTIGVFLGKGDGTFAAEQQYQLADAPISLAVGDFNGDGKLDIMAGLVAIVESDSLAVLPGFGNGSFGTAVVSQSPGIVVAVGGISLGDLNHDGIPDAVIESDGAILTMLGKGDGSFTVKQVVLEPFVIAYPAAAVGDINEDGCPDIVVLDTLAHVITFSGNCDGTVTRQAQYTVGDTAVTVALQDVNKDGHLDVVTGGFLGGDLEVGANAGNLLSILLGDGKGNFGVAAVYRGDESLVALAFADLNGDGFPDVVSANEDSDTLTVFLNDEQGGFGAPNGYAVGYGVGAVNSPISWLVQADLNGDGKKDLVLMELPTQLSQTGENLQLVTLINQGTGKFAPRIEYPVAPSAVYSMQGDFALGDFHNTGHPDFVAIGSFAGPPFLSFLPNQGDGTFGNAVLSNPPAAQGSMAIGDFNHDGKLDFVTIGAAGTATALTLFLGHGDGTFTPLPSIPFLSGSSAGLLPRSVYATDLNHDGKLDVLVYLHGNVVPYTSNAVFEFLGNGDGTFQPPVMVFANSDPLTLADVNGDGIPDLVMCKDPESNYPSEQPTVVTIYLGHGDGSFVLAHTYKPYTSTTALESFGTENGGVGWCQVADFNGDGKPDIAVWQHSAGVFSDRYVQYLMGNGDGSFTPTYDVLRVRKIVEPQLTFDLNGDGLADLVELDDQTASFNYIPGAQAPPFQIGLLAQPVLSLGELQITLDVPSTTDTLFMLQASEAGVVIPATVTIPAGKISQVVDFHFATAFNRNHVFSITATTGTISETTYGAPWNGLIPTGIAVSLVTPFGSTIPGGTTSNYDVSIGTIGSYSTTATLTCQGLPSGAHCHFSPDSFYLPGDNPDIAAGGLGSMIVSSDSSIVPGTYKFVVVASDGATTASTPATLTILVPGPDLTGNVISSSSYPGVGTALTVNVSFQNKGTTAATSVLVNFGVSGPASITSVTPSQGACTVSSCNLNALSAGRTAQLTFALQPSAAGTVTLQASATPTPSDLMPGNNTVTFSSSVTDYSLTVSPSTVTISAGKPGQFQATIKPIGGAFLNNIVLGCSGAPAGIQCAVPNNSLIPDSSTVDETVTVSLATSSTTMTKNSDVTPRLTLLAFGVGLGFILCGSKRRQKLAIFMFVILLVCLAMSACGGGGSSQATSSTPSSSGSGSPLAGTYHITITASSGTSQKAVTLTVIVQ